MGKLESVATLMELEWDTAFFGVSSAKCTLSQPIERNNWLKLLSQFNNYHFVSINNMNSDPTNARLIGQDTSAFLVDVNIQFEKKILSLVEIPKNIIIRQSLEENKQIIQMANFEFSKFTQDPELSKRGGDLVYQNWLMNSFGKTDKFYALSKNNKGFLNGFLLFSYTSGTCVIELIAVSQEEVKGGIGSSLFKAVEHYCYKNEIKVIKVGTQIRNQSAINFYHKVGCKQVGCHQIYHLWNQSFN
ncbi:GNAT family N-acetyltransferase [Rossellomorea marisflavi]|uniref:GNAT family N-acetyltransferase n=1 Tax=Rossellomorea marisflavi TaxID=189381 RepID=UPI00345DBEC0